MKIKNAIKPNATIKQCAELLNEEGKKICFVVAETGVLEGVVTDSDIRRAILNDVKMDAPISQIMNAKPICRTPSDDDEQIKLEVDRLGIQAIPVVDESMKIVKIIYGSFIEQKAVDNTTVFIQAGGLGTRLGELTKETPKPMLKVDGTPMLERMLVYCKKQGFSDFIISTYYLADKITSYFGDGSKFGVTIEYTKEEIPLGTAGALSLLQDHSSLKDNLIMVNGDVLTNIDFRKLAHHHYESDAETTICVKEHNVSIPYGVCQISGEHLLSIQEKPNYTFLVNTGIYVLKSQLIKKLVKNQAIDMPNFITKLKEQNGNVIVYPIFEYWLDIGQPDEFKKAQTDVSIMEEGQ